MKSHLAVLLLASLFASTAPAADWQTIRAPGFWEKRFEGVVEEHDGVAWLRCVVTVPAEWKDHGENLTLSLGQIDDVDETFINGTKVGGMGTRQPFKTASEEMRRYSVAAKLVRFGEPNLIAVKVFDGGGAGGFQAGPLQLKSAKAAMNLSGNWQLLLGDDVSAGGWPGGNAGSEQSNAFIAAFAKAAGESFGKPVDNKPLPGTKELTMEGDIASTLVAGVDKFLLRKLDESIKLRERHWKRNFSSAEAYNKSIEPNRERLADILGMRDRREVVSELELVGSVIRPALVARGEGYDVYNVRWPVLENPDPRQIYASLYGEGLLLVPTNREPIADIVAIPDCQQLPEHLIGIVSGVPEPSQFARRLAENGCRVLVPVLADRDPRFKDLSPREYVYRSAFELGRHLVGYEVHKILAGVQWFGTDAKMIGKQPLKVAVIGYGEGGMLALYAAALDTSIDAVCVGGYVSSRQNIWQEPIDRNVFGLLDQFGDAELISMVAPRPIIVEALSYPEGNITTRNGAPAVLVRPPTKTITDELQRAAKITAPFKDFQVQVVISDGRPKDVTFLGQESCARLLKALGVDRKMDLSDKKINWLVAHDIDPRPSRQVKEMDRHNQLLLRESTYVRKAFMKNLTDVAAKADIAAYEKAVEEYRTIFKNDVIGAFDDALLPANPRTRKIGESDKWTQYEVVLDVWEDVIAYGILTLPKGIKDGERRPVVVCQHGLEGRPQSVIGDKDFQYYKAFATKLAERGFVTFAPQNLYIFEHRFRTLQRKANPLGKTLFSIIVPQHQQITDWLKTLPQVDGERIGFYGLSYGGKSAMRIPPLVKNYCLSICSADFNEWVDKNASTRGSYSYVNTGEYEIFEWDLGSTFNYAEMAALIAPRPFMVERGHFDGVGIDEQVAYEYAKVQHLYQALLKIGDRSEIEWFVGPHTINGVGTYEFLHKWLKHPKP